MPRLSNTIAQVALVSSSVVGIGMKCAEMTNFLYSELLCNIEVVLYSVANILKNTLTEPLEVSLWILFWSSDNTMELVCL